VRERKKGAQIFLYSISDTQLSFSDFVLAFAACLVQNFLLSIFSPALGASNQNFFFFISVRFTERVSLLCAREFRIGERGFFELV
jgi:hypothetical protein